MLNSNFSRIDPENSENNQTGTAEPSGKKLDEFLIAITEARKSLQNWNDQKTEALIRLDSLTYDMRAIEKEKREVTDTNRKILEAMSDQTREYRAHVDAMTDEVQILKMENESLRNDLKSERENAHAEQDTLRESFQAERDSLVSERETRRGLQQELNTLRDRTAQGVSALKEVTTQFRVAVAESEAYANKVKQLEAELSGIRSQVMTVLRVSDVGIVESTPIAHSAKVERENAKVNYKETMKTHQALNTSGEEPKRLQAVEIESVNSVEEYLRRCGY
jgi:chromosome segregation ATPase